MSVTRMCLVDDEAIDKEKTNRVEEVIDGVTVVREVDNIEKYRNTRDEKLLVFHEGKTPVWFTIRSIKHGYMLNYLDGMTDLAARLAQAFRAACHEVFDATKKRYVPKSKVEGGQLVAEADWLEVVGDMVGMRAIVEIGLASIMWSQLPESKRPTSAS